MIKIHKPLYNKRDGVFGTHRLIHFLSRITDFSVKLEFTEEGLMTKIAFALEPEGKKMGLENIISGAKTGSVSN